MIGIPDQTTGKANLREPKICHCFFAFHWGGEWRGREQYFWEKKKETRGLVGLVESRDNGLFLFFKKKKPKNKNGERGVGVGSVCAFSKGSRFCGQWFFTCFCFSLRRPALIIVPSTSVSLDHMIFLPFAALELVNLVLRDWIHVPIFQQPYD